MITTLLGREELMRSLLHGDYLETTKLDEEV